MEYQFAQTEKGIALDVIEAGSKIRYHKDFLIDILERISKLDQSVKTQNKKTYYQDLLNRYDL